MSFARVIQLSLIAVLAWLSGGCEQSDDQPKRATGGLVVEYYAELTYRQYVDAVAGAERLSAAIIELLDNPNADTLATARRDWIAARRAYMPTEARRGWDGPIDHASSGVADPLPDGPEVFINSWPLDEAYLDYTSDDDGNPLTGGLIYDDVALPSVTENNVRAANAAGGDANVALGYHALEFLLWGQDRNPSGPGQRPATDFIPTAIASRGPHVRLACRTASVLSAVMSTDVVASVISDSGAIIRRRELVALLAELLVRDLSAVRDAWAPGSAWRTTWVAQPVRDALADILAGCAFLAKDELTNARIQVAFDLAALTGDTVPGPGGSQEEEHSCFSDTTHLDIRDDVLAIRTALEGTWTGMFETSATMAAEERGAQSLLILLDQVDGGVASRLRHALAVALTAAQAIADAGDTGEAFERQVLINNPNGRARVQRCLDRLNELAIVIDQAVAVLGLNGGFIEDND